MGGYRTLGCIGLVLILTCPLPLSAGQKQVVLEVGDLWQASKVLGSGKYLVVYFYPAAMTGGCTKQACAYRDSAAPLKKEGIHVVGVSADSVKSLKYFRDAHGLNFPLLSDVNGYIAKRFGVPIRDGGSIKRTVQGREVTLERPLIICEMDVHCGSLGQGRLQEHRRQRGRGLKNRDRFSRGTEVEIRLMTR